MAINFRWWGFFTSWIPAWLKGRIDAGKMWYNLPSLTMRGKNCRCFWRSMLKNDTYPFYRILHLIFIRIEGPFIYLLRIYLFANQPADRLVLTQIYLMIRTQSRTVSISAEGYHNVSNIRWPYSAVDVGFNGNRWSSLESTGCTGWLRLLAMPDSILTPLFIIYNSRRKYQKGEVKF